MLAAAAVDEDGHSLPTLAARFTVIATGSTLQLHTIESVMAKMQTIDLGMVKLKLMDADEGPGWSEQHASVMELRYRRYLCMLFLDPQGSVVPTRDIDLVWHQHILDTRAYAADCERVFGYFVHHFPYFGMRDDQDAQDLLDSFEQTNGTYRELFGEDYCSSSSDHDAGTCHKGPGNCHKCKSGCSGIKCKTCKSK
jgi:hypothetical protein